MQACLGWIQEWNTVAPNCHAAHAVLHAIVTTHTPQVCWAFCDARTCLYLAHKHHATERRPPMCHIMWRSDGLNGPG